MAEGGGTDLNVWQAFGFAIGGIFTVMGAGFLFTMGQISGVEKRRKDDSEKFWARANLQGREDLLQALEVERRFATKSDLKEMEERIYSTMRTIMREHENNVKENVEKRLQEIKHGK